MFIDETKIKLETGRGGNGSKSIHREKFLVRGKPDGGDGGRGGHIYFKSSSSLHTLYDIDQAKMFKTIAGEDGKADRKHGKSGIDKTILVPLGTKVIDKKGQVLAYFQNDQEKKMIAEGGNGGKGNMNFKNASNKGTTKISLGGTGVKFEIKLELRLIADCGLIGLPNAGKSSLIQRLTNSQSKVGDYAFTTLRPFLGVVKHNYGSFVLADIPGLIKGAASGKGLGNRFLKHISHCRFLVFVIDAHKQQIKKDYLLLLNELQSYEEDLSKRTKIILLNKIDLLDSKTDLKSDKGLDCQVIPVSAVSGKGLTEFIQSILQQIAQEKLIHSSMAW